MPFAIELGIELDVLTPELTTATMAWAERLCSVAGTLHGGAMMAFADTVGAVCAYLNLPEGAGTATIDSTTRMFRPHLAGLLTATARPTNIGRTIIAVLTELHDEQGRLVAQTSQAQAVLR